MNITLTDITSILAIVLSSIAIIKVLMIENRQKDIYQTLKGATLSCQNLFENAQKTREEMFNMMEEYFKE